MDKQSENNRLNQLIRLTKYRRITAEIVRLEQERIFCGHDMEHFLAVARLAWIYNLEEGLGLHREIVYTAAFLHDIGRYLQYTQGVPHHQGSVRLAVPMLDAERHLFEVAVDDAN